MCDVPCVAVEVISGGGEGEDGEGEMGVNERDYWSGVGSHLGAFDRRMEALESLVSRQDRALGILTHRLDEVALELSRRLEGVEGRVSAAEDGHLRGGPCETCQHSVYYPSMSLRCSKTTNPIFGAVGVKAFGGGCWGWEGK